MSDSDLPPLWVVLALLSNLIVSVATVWYIVISFFQCSTCTISPVGIILIIAFSAVFILSGFSLVFTLMPQRKEFCPVCSLVSRIMEIDLRVR